jgi:hypothetical protein
MFIYRYVYGKPVDGKAKITLNLVDQDGISEFLLESNSLRVSLKELEIIYFSYSFSFQT